MDDQPPPAAKPRSRTRLIVQAVFSLALVVVLFYYLLKDVDLAQVWANIRAMTWREDAILLVLAAWNLATYGLVWMSVTPGLGFGRAMVMTQAASAVTNTVPTVGPAIGVGLTYTMFRSWGYSGSRTSVAVLVSGVWNVFVKLGLPVLALALVLLQGGAGGGRVTLALAGIAVLVGAIVVFALLLRSEELARRFGLLAGRVRLAAAAAGAAPAGAWLGAGHGAIPHPDAGAAGARLGADHRRHAGQPPVVVPGAAGLPARGGGQRHRGLLGAGVGGVCVHAADYHDPGHPW
jgi:hypothetical protein